MKQKEVRDENNILWQCVQPLSGSITTEKESIDKIKTENDQIRVVCTPTKAAQSVDILVPVNWLDELSEEDLLKKIKEGR